jgi:hypothetical protein
MRISPLHSLAFGLLTLGCSAVEAHASLPSRNEALLSRSEAWGAGTVLAVGEVRGGASAVESAGDILAVYLAPGDESVLRVSLVAPVGIIDRVDHFTRGRVQVIALFDDGPGGDMRLPAPLSGEAPFAWDRMLVLDPSNSSPGLILRSSVVSEFDLEHGNALSGNLGIAQSLPPSSARFHLERGWMAASLPAGASPQRVAVFTVAGGRELDRLVTSPERTAVYTANVAFFHFGNQGLGYSDVFHGRSGAEQASGFDEILEVHEQKNIPVNVHLSGLLQSSAEWDARNGDPQDFNAWLRTGAAAGWIGIVSSVYGQAIIPFMQGAMNDWAVDREVAMETFRYNYTPHVAWVPERVWLTPGQYPGNGVNDFTGNHWQAHGINAVILDDSPHCNGHDAHRIHTVAANGLRIIPRDGYFTGRMHVGDGAAALAVLTGLADSGVGQYRLVTYADDWEQAAEMGNWANDYPFALDTYLWMIDKCQTESAWLHTWKLDPAINNADFNGDTFTPVNSTYGGIGDVNGYGGSNNAWYADWAGYIPYANGGNGNGGCGGGGNCKNHGQLWNDAHAALQAAPSNNLREAGWYVMMTNLHETAWHDYLGGPISGWQRNYSGHIKNANVYAEGARWAGGLYGAATGAFFSDVDNDGNNELILYNDRVFAVFESIGGRCAWLFAKGSGYNYSVVGIDDAYWFGTEADYNDGNHVAALSDVGPNHQNDFYGMQVDVASGNTVKATFTQSGVTKTISLTLGQPYLNCVYRVGANTQYIKSGWSPDLVDLLYNAEMDRIYAPNVSYMGRRNPNTGATAAYVIGSGGAGFQGEFSGTLMKGDEIYGTQKFQFYIYAGATSAPDGSGNVAELSALATGLTDLLAPEARSGTYFPATHQLTLTFDEAVRYNQIVPTSIAIDDDNDGVADATLDGGTTVITGSNAPVITLQVSNAVHSAIQALDHNQMRLLLQSGAVRDVAGNTCAALTNAGNVFVSYGPPTLITLDGRFDASEWPTCAVAVADSFDSQWNAAPNNITNEIQALYATWDATYLYLGLRGIATGNSWLLYLDTDPGGANGQTDLRNTNAWERGVQFTASGFKADWEFGAYQHQGAFDSQSFFKITGATTTTSYSDSILKAFDPAHAFGLNGGSEIAIPWSALYGIGAGHVTPGAQLGLVATLCYDPEPSGEAGGDQAPSNVSATAPTLDNRKLIVLDANADGLPDAIDRAGPVIQSAAYSNGVVRSGELEGQRPGDVVAASGTIAVTFNEPLTAATANQVSRYSVFETANPGVSLTIQSATQQANPRVVHLAVTGLTNAMYTVVASGVSDTTCFHNTTSQTSAPFQEPLLAVDPHVAPSRLALALPQPNPTSRGRTTLAFSIPADASSLPSALELFDLNGRLARTLARGPMLPGYHRVAFDGRNDRGERLAPGIYYVRLSRGVAQDVKRLVVLP